MEVPAETADSTLGFERPAVPSDLYESRSARLVPSVQRGIVILVTAALVTTMLGLLMYRPLSGSMPGEVTGASVTAPDGGRFVVGFKEAATFEYTFAVRNDGRWGVTITGMKEPAHGAFDDVSILATPPGATNATPIDSFALGAGQTASITVKIAFSTCETPLPTDGRTAWNREILSYRVLGVAREMIVELPYRLAIDSAAAPRC